MIISEQKRLGVIALSLCLGGLFLGALIEVLAEALGHNANKPAHLITFGSQVAAFVLGILSRQTAMGKAAYISAATFFSVVFVGSVYLYG